MNTRQYTKEIKRIKKSRADLLNKLSKSKFNTKNHMLFCLQQAYRHILDNVVTLPMDVSDETKKDKKRLTWQEEFNLGKNLALYWEIRK